MSYDILPRMESTTGKSRLPRPYTSRPKTTRPRTSKFTGGDVDSTAIIDTDYRPIRIKVFKNGDQYDPGTEVFVTRREFKHWLMLLDMITKKINSRHVVQKLYDLDGDEVTEFQELEENGQYVAAGFERLKPDIRYGKYRTRVWQPPTKRPPHVDPTSVDSHESIEIYLKKLGFESQSGRQYPFDDPDKDPATKAAVEAASLEKAVRRQQVKEERASRAATRLSRYHSDGSLPRIDQNNRVAQRIEAMSQEPPPSESPRNYSDNSLRTEQRYRSGYKNNNRYWDPHRYRRDYERDAEWENSKYRPVYYRRRSYDEEYDQGYGSAERQYSRRHSPPALSSPPAALPEATGGAAASRGRQLRENANRASSRYGGDRSETRESTTSYYRPKTSNRAKSAHNNEVFERLAKVTRRKEEEDEDES